VTDPSAIPIAELLPHGPNMIVIDRLITYGAAKSLACATVRRGNKFFDGAGVPAWAGIEYMAQTVAAHAGFEARLHGLPPPLGVLLGTRAYECHAAEFPLGAELAIAAEPLVLENGLASFRCVIEHHAPLASAVINVYRPGDDEIARLISRSAAR
jgi:predicted hotdog family 3-hydroxylacyl-ACP dehydratase